MSNVDVYMYSAISPFSEYTMYTVHTAYTHMYIHASTVCELSDWLGLSCLVAVCYLCLGGWPLLSSELQALVLGREEKTHQNTHTHSSFFHLLFASSIDSMATISIS